MKIGEILMTAEGLETLAKVIKTLNAKVARLEIHQDDDTHVIIRLCCYENTTS